MKESFCDEISSLCLVKECRDLEEAMQTEFTEGILKGETVEARQRKKEIQEIDRDRVLARCEEKYPMHGCRSGKRCRVGQAMGCLP